MNDNTDVVQRAYNAFAQGDVTSIMALLDDNVTWHAPKTLPQGGKFHGKEEVGQFFAGVVASWQKISLRIETVGAVGDEIVVGIVHGDGILTNGSESGYGAVHVFHIVKGKITSFHEYTDLDLPLV